jgi:transcriptional regulator with GAF, ATPase, and Fis domain
VEGAVQVSESDIGWLMLRDETSKTFLLMAHRNLPEGWAKKINRPLEDGISSLVSLSGESLLIHGKPLEKFIVSTLGKAVAVVPIKVQNEVIGLLIALRKDERAYGQTEQTLLEAVADYASISLVNAQLFRALEQAAENAKSGQERQNSLLESYRNQVQDRIQEFQSSVELLLREDAGPLTDQQREKLQMMQSSLGKLDHQEEKADSPVSQS